MEGNARCSVVFAKNEKSFDSHFKVFRHPSFMEDALNLMASQKDSQKVAGLLMYSKLPNKTDASNLLKVYRTIGSLFIRRLLASSDEGAVGTSVSLLLSMMDASSTLRDLIKSDTKLVRGIPKALRVLKKDQCSVLRLIESFPSSDAILPLKQLIEEDMHLDMVMMSCSACLTLPLLDQKGLSVLAEAILLKGEASAEFIKLNSLLVLVLQRLEEVPKWYPRLAKSVQMLMQMRLDDEDRLNAFQKALCTLGQFPLAWREIDKGHELVVSIVSAAATEVQVQIESESCNDQLLALSFELCSLCILESESWEDFSFEHLGALLRRLKESASIVLEFALEHPNVLREVHWRPSAGRFAALYVSQSEEDELETLFDQVRDDLIDDSFFQ